MSDDELLADALALADRLDGRDGRVVRGLVARWERARDERDFLLYEYVHKLGEYWWCRTVFFKTEEEARAYKRAELAKDMAAASLDAPGGPTAQDAGGE